MQTIKNKMTEILFAAAMLAMFLCVQAGMIACDVIDTLSGHNRKMKNKTKV